MKAGCSWIWLISLCLVPVASGMTVGTYNIRQDNVGDIKRGNSWAQRAPVIAGLIRFHDFDVLGTQEGFEHQMEDLRELLPGHACSAYGRDDGVLAGEQVAIFYKEDKFELKESGRFWLSETPDEPSRGWDAALPRLCGWAKLRTKADDREFYVFNLHMDHRGEVSRLEATKLVLGKVEEIAGDATVFLVGDFNTDQRREPYRLLTEDSGFKDAYEAASIRHAPNGTANGFDPDAKSDSRIDHVFVGEEMKVRRYGVLTDTYRAAKRQRVEDQGSGDSQREAGSMEYEARLPSDHFPVLVEVEW